LTDTERSWTRAGTGLAARLLAKRTEKMQQPGATDDSAPPCQTSTVGSAPDAPACVWHEVSGSTLSCTSGRITHARTDPGPSGASTRTATKAGTAPCRAEALLLAITGLPWAPSRRSATGSPGWSLLSAHRGTPGLCTDRRVRTSRRVRTRDDRSRGGALARRRRSTRSRRREAVAQSRGTGIRLCRGPTGRYAIEANETRKVPDAAQRASWRVSSRSARTVFGDLANGSGLCDGLGGIRQRENPVASPAPSFRSTRSVGGDAGKVSDCADCRAVGAFRVGPTPSAAGTRCAPGGGCRAKGVVRAG
jgi:hypothetical protein